MSDAEIVRVRAEHLTQLLPLMRAYCEFYEASPSDKALRGLTQALLDDPDRAGIQLLARDRDRQAIGFATIFWTFSTLSAAPIGLMNDLYVAPAARGRGIGRALIERLLGRVRATRRGGARVVHGAEQPHGAVGL